MKLHPDHAIAPVITQNKQPVLQMVKRARMAGSVPSWVQAADGAPDEKTGVQAVMQTLSQAQTGTVSENSAVRSAYAAPDLPGQKAEEPFSFFDLLDVVNPLHHVPVLGTLYQSISGDQIKPAGRLAGSMLWGGAAGAAAGFVNVILEHETGHDALAHAAALFEEGSDPQHYNGPARSRDDLAVALLQFTASPAHQAKNTG